MGLDVVAISRARAVRCKGGESCDDTHYSYSPWRWRRQGVKEGCYKIGRGGRSFGFRAGSYVSYDLFLQELCLLTLGAATEVVWDNQRKYARQPFFQLIVTPAGTGLCFGPVVAAKLYDDFSAWATRARKHFLGGRPLSASVKRELKKEGLSSPRIQQRAVSNVRNLAKALGAQVAMPPTLDISWMWETYRDFRRAFRLASDRGFLLFC